MTTSERITKIWRGAKPAMTITQRAMTIQNMARWCRVPTLQKSTRMIRRPLKAWKTMPATSASSPRPMIGFLYVAMTPLYASGETRISAVSSTCTSRKKKIATPVTRCSTHDHMPSWPR